MNREIDVFDVIWLGNGFAKVLKKEIQGLGSRTGGRERVSLPMLPVPMAASLGPSAPRIAGVV
jgi:hypothetical protein